MSRNQSLKDRPTYFEPSEDFWLNLGVNPGKEPQTPPQTPQLTSTSPVPDDFRTDNPPQTPVSGPDSTEHLPDLVLPPARKPSAKVSQKVVSASRPPKQPSSKPLPPLRSRPVPTSTTPPVSVPIPRKRTLKTLPDRASAAIQRVVNHRIKKQKRAKQRPRMTKDPRSSPYHCRICEKTCTGRVQWHEHLRSEKHNRRENPQQFRCEDCDVTVYSIQDLDRHKNGVNHRLRVLRFQ